MPRLEFFFDCSSPWTYLAFHNVQLLARELAVPITWRPILVGGVFNAVNPAIYANRAQPVPAKQAYARKALQGWAQLAGLSINPTPSVFPVNSVKVMRACLVLAPDGLLPAYARAAFEAYWRDDRDLSDDAVVRNLCMRVGASPDRVMARIAEADVKQALRANTDELIARGGFGSPTLFVDGDDMVFGNDHLPLVRAALQRRLG